MSAPALRGLSRACASWSKLLRRSQLLRCGIVYAPPHARRLHRTAAAFMMEAQPAAGAGELPHVQPPATVPYNAEAANTVAVSGTVLTDPQLHQLPASQFVSHVRLGLSAPASRPELAQPLPGAVQVDAWGALALQLAQHVRKGDRIAVRGALREDRWQDKRTSEWRRSIKVVVDELAMLAPPPEGEHPAAAAAALEALHHEQQAAAEVAPPAVPPLQPAAVPRLPQASRSADASRQLYEGVGQSLDQVAAARGIKASTVVDHLVACAAAGSFSSYARLAGELQLGPPGGPWLSAAEVAEAVADVEQALPPGTPLGRLPLRAIREQLEAGPGTAPKVAALLAQRGGDPTLVFGCIKLTLAALEHGIDLRLMAGSPPLPGSAPPPPF